MIDEKWPLTRAVSFQTPSLVSNQILGHLGESKETNPSPRPRVLVLYVVKLACSVFGNSCLHQFKVSCERFFIPLPHLSVKTTGRPPTVDPYFISGL